MDNLGSGGSSTHAAHHMGLSQCTRAALAAVAHDQRERGKLISAADDKRGPVPGLFGLAMGKHGANELNYSSDIDLICLFDQDRYGPDLGL